MAAKAADPAYNAADLALIRLDTMEAKWTDAGSKLKDVLATDTQNSKARLWLGNVEAAKGDQKAALEHLKKVIDTDPSNAQALNNYAYLLSEHAKKPDEALKYAQKAVEIAPEDPDFADTLGWILYQKGVYPTAIRHLERAAAKKGNAAWKYHLAMAYAKGGEARRAQATLDAALKMDPNSSEAKAASQVVQLGK
jgi:Tfp pilus assembly protein PilF